MTAGRFRMLKCHCLCGVCWRYLLPYPLLNQTQKQNQNLDLCLLDRTYKFQLLNSEIHREPFSRDGDLQPPPPPQKSGIGQPLTASWRRISMITHLFLLLARRKRNLDGSTKHRNLLAEKGETPAQYTASSVLHFAFNPTPLNPKPKLLHPKHYSNCRARSLLSTESTHLLSNDGARKAANVPADCRWPVRSFGIEGLGYIVSYNVYIYTYGERDMCICIYRYVHIHTELTYINYKGFKPINRYITNEQQVTRWILRRTHTDTHTHTEMQIKKQTYK